MVIEALPWLPQSPSWKLDWDAVIAACPWLLPLAAVPQDPIFHAEGDVLTHTRMVAEALVALPAWQALSPLERTVLFIATLLHDIGKAETTQQLPDGRISSPGHARVGAGIARRLLWTSAGLGEPLPLMLREAIVALVRVHALPIWLIDAADFDWVLLPASWRVQLYQVALLAEADMRGRFCVDQADLLTRIDLFRTACNERDCLMQPFPFPNAQSRVRYCRALQSDPRYAAYDDSWGEVIIMAGLPGVGKDTWIRAHAQGLPVIALDAIRRELDVEPEDAQGIVVAAAKELARDYLRRHQPFIWNATNLTRRVRDPLVDLILSYDARVRIVYLDAPLDTVLQRNRRRGSRVPEKVIQRLATKIELPLLVEAHQVDLLDTRDQEPRAIRR